MPGCTSDVRLNFPKWKGNFFRRSSPRQWLEILAQQWAGRDQYTFYRMPSAKTSPGGTRRPGGITFVLKAPQRTPTSRACETSTNRCGSSRHHRKLNAKLGPVLFQYPPILRKTSRGSVIYSTISAGCPRGGVVPSRHRGGRRRVRSAAEHEHRVVHRGTGEGTAAAEVTADFGYVRYG